VREGLAWAFVAGIFLDLFSISPLGATSLAFMGAVLAISLVQESLPSNRVLLPPLLAALGTAVYFFIYLLLLTLLGYQVNWQATGVTPIIILHALLIVPIYWLTAGLNRLARPRRVEI
jgi:cell shape-determining protein MreD